MTSTAFDKLTRACEKLGAAASAVPLDVSNEDAVKQAFGMLDRIDHLVTAASGSLRGRLMDLNTGLTRGRLESKFWGQYYCIKYGAPRMARGSSIVLFSGWVSRKPAVEMSTMAAINGASEALAGSLALELAPVRVNTIMPGQIDTPPWHNGLAESEAQAYFARVAQSRPVRRAGAAEHVASAVVFLMRNGFMTGSVLDILDIDSGWR